MLNVFDVLFVGGGPAGLSAALVLGRYRRSVLVVDAGPLALYARGSSPRREEAKVAGGMNVALQKAEHARRA